MSKKQLMIMIAVIVFSAGAVGIYVATRADQPVKERKVIYDAEDDNEPLEDRLLRIPKDAKSATCDQISTKEVEQAAGFKADVTRISLQNTSSDDGQASGCSYISTNEDDAIKAVSITTRNYKEIEKADSAFAVLEKGKQKFSRSLSNDAFYNAEQSQLVSIKDTRLYAVTISRRNDKQLSEDTFRKLNNILP